MFDFLVGVKPLSEDKLNKMLNKAKMQLFRKKNAGFLGSLMCSHKFIWDHDPYLDTAWCDGTTIGWNPQFFAWLDPEERVTVLAHELWHTAFQHMLRFNKVLNPEIWNHACDYIINNMLKHAGFVFGPKLESLGLFQDHQYDGMTTEQVYELILPKYAGMIMPAIGEIQDGYVYIGGNPSHPRCMERSDMAGPWEKYRTLASSHNDLRSPSAAQITQVMNAVVKAIQAAKMSKEFGNLPGELTILVEEFLNPILPWEILLQRYFTELSKDDYSWKRPSRRYDDEYLPSLLGESGLDHLIYYMDVSGSVTDEDLKRFTSEVKYIHSNLAPKKLTVVTFDDEIQDVYEFADDDDFDRIEMHGRGGTSLKEVFEHIEKHKPTAAVIFSDLYCSIMEKDPKVPVLWVVVGNPKAVTRFGQMIHIQNE